MAERIKLTMRPVVQGFLFAVFVTGINGLTPKTCENDAQCEFYMTNSVCVEKVCQCKAEDIESGDGSKCLPVAIGYGDACEDNVQCSAVLNSGGSCENKICQCVDGYHYLKGECWKSVPLNGKCFLEEQCYAGYDFVGITCKDEVCVCRDEYYTRGETCRRKLESEETCLFDIDCYCQDGKCEGFKCKCASSSIEKFDVKKSRVKVSYASVTELGSDCTASDQCAGVANAKCVDNRECGCEPGRVGSLANNKCVKVAVEFGKTACTENGVCNSFGTNSICSVSGSSKVCSCIDGSHFDQIEKLCRRSRLIGEDCDVDNDCVAALNGNAQCSNKKCVCNSGNHEAEDGKSCRSDGQQVGDACVEDSDCILPNSVCDVTLHSCQCTANHFEKNKVCVAGIGSECKDNGDCMNVSHTFCQDFCTCVDGVPSGASDKCLPVIDVNGQCQETVQCDPKMGPLKECKEDVCSCQDGSQYILGRCYTIIKLGEKCKARAECVFPGSSPDAFMCQNGICACQYGYERNGDDCV